MEKWQDQGIVLSARAHGENGAIVSLLTIEQGRAIGYVRGAQGTKMRGSLEVGNLVDVEWQSRTSEGLGAFSLELSRNYSAAYMQNPVKLAALQAACGLTDEALPEREKHAGLFHGMIALFESLESEIWGAAYVMWEIAFLKELGFSLDLSECASGNGDQDLLYVSPKTGKAVSRSAGAPYKGKLLSLPAFLRPHGGSSEEADVYDGLRMNAHFLEHWVFVHHSRGMPEMRLIFERRFAKTVESQSLKEHAYVTG